MLHRRLTNQVTGYFLYLDLSFFLLDYAYAYGGLLWLPRVQSVVLLLNCMDLIMTHVDIIYSQLFVLFFPLLIPASESKTDT